MCPVVSAENVSFIVTCVNEARCGCTVFVAVNRSSAPPVVTPVIVPVNVSAANVTVSLPHLASAVVDVWAVDGAGNRSPVTTLTWTLETLQPQTLWPPLPPFVNASTQVLAFNCSKSVACTFLYDLDGVGWRAVGNSSSDAVVVGTAVDTRVLAAPAGATRNQSASFVLDAVVPVGSPPATAVDVRLDGAVAWTPVAVNATYTVSGLAEGVHTLEARAR